MEVDVECKAELDAAQVRRAQARHNAMQEHSSRMKKSQEIYKRDCEEADNRYRITRDFAIFRWEARKKKRGTIIDD
jgi:hypothetical protein